VKQLGPLEIVEISKLKIYHEIPSAALFLLEFAET